MIKDYIYLEPGNNCFYIAGKGLHRDKCYICGNKRKTTAHHIVPKRMHKFCKNKNLKEIRIRVCKSCEELMHPENVIIKESDMVTQQRNNINNLREAINWRNKKITAYDANINKFKKKLSNFKAKLAEICDAEYKYNGVMPGHPTDKDYELYSKTMKIVNMKNCIKNFSEYLAKFSAEVDELFNLPDEQFHVNQEKEDIIQNNLQKVEDGK